MIYDKAKQIFGFLFVLSGFIPALILFCFCVIILAKMLIEFEFEFKSVLFILTSIMGILGFVGLLFLFIGIGFKKAKLTLTLLVSGLLACILFTSFGGEQAWKWLLTIEEPDEWFIFAWPCIVSIVYCLILGVTILKKPKIV